MQPFILRDKRAIEAYLRGDIDLHLYGIGDLDDFFWPYTTWYAAGSESALDAVAMLYSGLTPPTFLGLSRESEAMRVLLEALKPQLPRHFHAHLSPGLESVFVPELDLVGHGEHYKMALRHMNRVTARQVSEVVPLSPADRVEILEFYQQSYPGNWFDARMLETRQYFGIRDQGFLVSIAGVHVYSQRYRVAALGNIATLPSHRNRGYAARVTSMLCQSLVQCGIEHIGANVKADNRSAIACYEGLGFERVASYGEFTVQRGGG